MLNEFAEASEHLHHIIKGNLLLESFRFSQDLMESTVTGQLLENINIVCGFLNIDKLNNVGRL